MLSPTPPFRLCCFIDRLQPRDKAAMLVVKIIKKNFFAEFADKKG